MLWSVIAHKLHPLTVHLARSTPPSPQSLQQELYQVQSIVYTTAQHRYMCNTVNFTRCMMRPGSEGVGNTRFQRIILLITYSICIISTFMFNYWNTQSFWPFSFLLSIYGDWHDNFNLNIKLWLKVERELVAYCKIMLVSMVAKLVI